ncbi:hypothetical protein HY991_05055 [Candidatus Micrarchaeota archaeon]|nr:hypothetical protein [Candidatus Micrarchaeota archaeon]
MGSLEVLQVPLQIVTSILAVIVFLYGILLYSAIRQQQAAGIERRRVNFTLAFMAASMCLSLSAVSLALDQVFLSLLFQFLGLLFALYGCFVRLERITQLPQILEKTRAEKIKGGRR